MNSAAARAGLALVLAFACAAPALAQLGGAHDDGVSLWRVLGALLLCLGLAVAGAFALRARMGGRGLVARLGTAKGQIELEENMRVNPQLQIVIVRCGEERILVAATPSGTPALLPLASRSEA